MRAFSFMAVGLAFVAALLIAVPAQAAEVPNHPQLLKRFPPPNGDPMLTGADTPAGNFEDACGLAVDSQGRIYVSDYYHDAVDVFDAEGEYLTRIGVEGPCGLAVDSSERLYVNVWHHEVVRFTAFFFSQVIDSDHPTGIAVDPTTDNLYVNDRTHISVYAPSGEPLLVEGEPLQIGEGTIGDGFGAAVSAFPATAGFVYVADAADQTVKVYDSALDKDNPVQVIDGAGTPQGGFVSLFDSTLALDQSNGHLFVADNTQPGFEHPAAVIDEFGPTGLYRDQIAHAFLHGEPVGLAVDGSAGPHNGEVYVTSGNGTSDVFPKVPNSEESVIYAFGPAGAVDADAAVGAEFAQAPGVLGLGLGGGATAAVGVEPAGAGAGATPAKRRKAKVRKHRRAQQRTAVAAGRPARLDK